MNARRPRTLAEVASRAASGEQIFDQALREFLDSFYANPETRRAAIDGSPPLLDALRDAYLAAVGEHLARCHDLEIPAWAETRGLDLQRPFFAGGLESLKARLFVESPTAFRRRMIFVSKDALFRPRAISPAA